MYYIYVTSLFCFVSTLFLVLFCSTTTLLYFFQKKGSKSSWQAVVNTGVRVYVVNVLVVVVVVLLLFGEEARRFVSSRLLFRGCVSIYIYSLYSPSIPTFSSPPHTLHIYAVVVALIDFRGFGGIRPLLCSSLSVSTRTYTTLALLPNDLRFSSSYRLLYSVCRI